MVDKKHNQKRIEELKEKKEINQEYTGLCKMIDSPDVESQELAEEIIKLKIQDVFLRDLSNDQKYAFVKIIQEFNEQDHDAILLKGYAGTGKTFLTQRIVEYLNTVYPYRKIGITAPTNKAVSVLYNLSPFKNKTTIFEEYGKPKDKLVYTTIHKLLGLKEKISADGVQSFVSDGDNDLNSYSYIIVDEVSMLADSLFNDLIQYKNDVKFLFVGERIANVKPL